MSQLWSEHKTRAPFRPEQREDYAAALATHDVAGRLLTITDVPSIEQNDGWEQRTWQQVGELADRVGAEWSGARWREAALEPSAPASARLLHELVSYLEQEGLTVVRAATEHDVFVFSHLVDTARVVDALLTQAAEHLGGGIDGGYDVDDTGDTDWVRVDPPQDAWLERVKPFYGSAEFAVSAQGGWSPQHRGEPLVGAGYTLDKRLHAVLSSKFEWVGALKGAHYALELWGGYVRVWRTRTLLDVLERGNTLDAQARELAQWAWQSIVDLSGLDPGEFVLPEPRRSRRRKGVTPTPGSAIDLTELHLDSSSRPSLDPLLERDEDSPEST